MIRSGTLLVFLGFLWSCSPSGEELAEHGRKLMDEGNFTEATSYLQRAVEKESENPDWQNMLGVCYFETGNYREAIGSWQQVIAIDSGSYRPYYNSGNAYVELQNYDQAIQYFSKAIELQPNIADIYLNRAAALVNKGYHDIAVADYNIALRLEPDNILAHVNLGKTLIKVYNLDEARNHLMEAVELDNRHAETHYWLAWIAINKGQSEEDPSQVEMGCSLLTRARKLGFDRSNEEMEKICSDLG